MKRYHFFQKVTIILIAVMLSACSGASAAPTATATALPTAIATAVPSATQAPEPTETFTPESPSPTPVPSASIKQDGANLRSGPGSDYPIIGTANKGDSISLLGQANDCVWYLVKLADGTTAWMAALTVETNQACEGLDVAEIPAPPATATSESVSAGASSGNPVPLGEVHSVKVNNKTGDTVYLTFVGAQTFNFVLPPGNGQRISLPAGSYTIYYTMCGGQRFYEQGAINANWFLDIKCP
ncbi:MAG: hypothetical protein EPO32_01055 [Anaerolineae bacterium]|nr:MAG: hypothetical protein EPO32_01055 [Anaerolineae bacterium]